MNVSYVLTNTSNSLFDWLDHSTSSSLGYYDFKPYFTSTDFPKIRDGKAHQSDYPKSAYYITDKGDHVLKFATTGFKRNELKLEIKDDILIVSGQKEKDDDKETLEEIYNSIAQRAFEVAYQLSEKLDTSKITTSYENGLLTIVIPLSEELKKKNRVIEVK
jgi:HSP20 family molecular chaperone IbpA